MKLSILAFAARSALLGSALVAGVAWAATDIATAPLWSTLTVNVKPNVLFVLDDSGSMADDFLPDDASNLQKVSAWSGSTPTLKYAQFGRLSSQCNGLAFNPALDYPPPIKWDGSALTAAKKDPDAADLNTLLISSNARNYSGGERSLSAQSDMNLSSVTVQIADTAVPATAYVAGMPVTVYDESNRGRWVVGKVTTWDAPNRYLTVSVVQKRSVPTTGKFTNPYVSYGTPGNQLYYTYVFPKPVPMPPDAKWRAPMSYTYPTGSLNTGDDFWQQCAKPINVTDGSTYFTANILTPDNPDTTLLHRYWRWNQYYKNRMQMMKTATSLAFQSLDNRYRIGFTTILEKTVAEGSRMLHVRDFDDTQKTKFYTTLDGVPPSGYTPLRGAVQKAGRYFAKKYPDQDYDPMQYSCQRNFLILSTDGYWNTEAEHQESDTRLPKDYGAYDINGALKIGNQDGRPTPRPMFDGATKTTTTVNTWKVVTLVTKTVKTEINFVQTFKRIDKDVKTTYTRGASCGSGKVTQTETKSSLAHTFIATSTDKLRTDVTPITVTTPWSQTIVRAEDGSSDKTVTGDPKDDPSVSTPGATTTTYDTVESGWTEVLPAPTDWTTDSSKTTCVKSSSAMPADSPVSTVPGTVPPATTTGSRTTATGSTTTSEVSGEPVKSAVTTKTTVLDSPGTSDTLADVAMYYYKTDLRDSALGNCTGALGVDVCENNVKPSSTEDIAATQHMTTFTLSLGNSGTMTYRPDYDTADSGDFFQIKQGGKNWPNPTAGAAKMDDLWHAAVNGRGRYFNANSPETLSASLTSALGSITSVTGSAAAAATSTLQPVAGNNGVYISQFKSPDWIGDVRKYEIDSSGKIEHTHLDKDTGESVDSAKWSAAAQLNAKSPATRAIKFFRKDASGSTGTLVDFDAASMSGTELALFTNVCDKAALADRLSQCSTVSATDLAGLNDPAVMVSYLRGVAKPGYRVRGSLLGDLVHSAPVFIGPSKFMFKENGYQDWIATKPVAERKPVLVVGSNDGLLHAFNEEDGNELWAYLPSLVMDKMYRLADQNYASKHQYMVDATPVVSDIYVKEGKSGSWKTVLIGGLGAGGRGFYALDVSDPASPLAMWEFSPDSLPDSEKGRLGLSFGNPIVTKRADGTWIVAVTSGYNNPSGGGYLFILDAATGALLKTVQTEVGGANVGEGLAKINAWIDSPEENLALRFYGGDLAGNLWRFDVDDTTEPKSKGFLLAKLQYTGPKDAGGSTPAPVPQPITTQPKLAQFDANGGTRRVIYVGTGRYLGKTDVPSEAHPASQQSIYAIVDDLSTDSLGDVRASDKLVKQNIHPETTPITVGDSTTPVDWSKKKGWYVDLMNTAERVDVDMLLVANTLVAAGNIPGGVSTFCEKPGDNQSNLYMFNIISGGGTVTALPTMLAGFSAVQIGDKIYDIEQGTNAIPYTRPITPLTVSSGSPRRTSWRELH